MSDTGKKRSRMAVVISHPIPHFGALCVRLAQQADFALRVFYSCASCIEQLVAPPAYLGQMSRRSVELSRTQDVEVAATAVSRFKEEVARG